MKKKSPPKSRVQNVAKKTITPDFSYPPGNLMVRPLFVYKQLPRRGLGTLV